ncbi:MAG: polysaccharide biosynthesis protein, partial [Pseudomonadota bacterium]
DRGRILVLEMGDPVNIVDLARQMIRLQGLQPDEDVQISFTGLRAGEKMHESLVDEDETAVATPCEGVMAIRPAIADLTMIRQRMDDLRDAAVARDPDKMDRLIRTLVPNFGGAVANAEGRTGAIANSGGKSEKTQEKTEPPVRLVRG